MGHEFVLDEKKDRVATITMNRPEVMNAIHPPMTAEMSAIFDDALDLESLTARLRDRPAGPYCGPCRRPLRCSSSVRRTRATPR